MSYHGVQMYDILRFMTQEDKQRMLEMTIAQMEDKLSILVQSALEAKEYSTSEESKAENKYDTRGLEASYLASGQAKRAQKLQEQIFLLKKFQVIEGSSQQKITVGHFVELEVDGSVSKYLYILPSGGEELLYQDKKIQVITLEAPIGKKMYNRELGYDFELNDKEYEIVGVF